MKVDPKGIVDHLRRAVRQNDRRTEDYLAGEIVDWIQRTDELADGLAHARAQRDGLRNLLGSVYRRLRDGREVSPSQMEALRICYDRRRGLDALPETGDE